MSTKPDISKALRKAIVAQGYGMTEETQEALTYAGSQSDAILADLAEAGYVIAPVVKITNEKLADLVMNAMNDDSVDLIDILQSLGLPIELESE